MNCIATAILSFRIRKGSVLGWMPFCFPGLQRLKKGERVLDLGTGTGIIPILMEAKTEAEDF